MEIKIIEDALFAAIAAIGFSSISRLPRRAYPYCAVIAALGHSLRLVLMTACSVHIVPATLLASFFIGTLSVLLSPFAKTPPEACFFPSLLPMIPGIYAYRAFGALGACIFSGGSPEFGLDFYRFAYNGLVCVAVLLAMVTGATVPVFIFKKISFRATR